MADRAGERIGGVGRRIARKGKQAPHHVLHLLFFGVAVTDHRLLDLQRGVLRNRKPGEHRSADSGAARLPERKRRLRIGVDEHYLDRDLAGSVRRDDAVQPLEDRLQPGRQVAGSRLDASARNVAQLRAARLDHSEAGDPQPGIDAEDSQSITARSEEHTSELQSHLNLVCRLLREKKKKYKRCVAAKKNPETYREDTKSR